MARLGKGPRIDQFFGKGATQPGEAGQAAQSRYTWPPSLGLCVSAQRAEFRSSETTDVSAADMCENVPKVTQKQSDCHGRQTPSVWPRQKAHNFIFGRDGIFSRVFSLIHESVCCLISCKFIILWFLLHSRRKIKNIDVITLPLIFFWCSAPTTFSAQFIKSNCLGRHLLVRIFLSVTQKLASGF